MHHTLLYQLLIISVSLHSISGIQIIRSKTGDSAPGVICNGGTLIVNDDTTHSLRCAKSLSQAGCDLRFLDSTDIKCVNVTGLNEFEILPNFGRQYFCDYGVDASIGDLFIQDYPNNLRAPIWYSGKEISKVNKSIVYTVIKNDQIKFKVLNHWEGFVIKIMITCKNSNYVVGDVVNDRRCVILKNIGYTPFPLETFTFIPATRKPIKTTSLDKKQNKNTTKLQYSVEGEKNEEITFALATAFGAVFIVLCISFTIMCIVKMSKHKKQDDEMGNEGIDQENQQINSTDVVIEKKTARLQIEDTNNINKKTKIVKKSNTKPGSSIKSLESQKEVFKKMKVSKSNTPTLQFSPIISVDTTSKRVKKRPNVFVMQEVTDGEEETNHTIHDAEGEWGMNEHSGDITVLEEPDQSRSTISPFTTEKQEILSRFESQEFNTFSNYDNDEDDMHLYARVTSLKLRRKADNNSVINEGNYENTDTDDMNRNDISDRRDNHIVELSPHDNSRSLQDPNISSSRSYIDPYDTHNMFDNEVDLTAERTSTHHHTNAILSEYALPHTSETSGATNADLSESIEAMFDLDETLDELYDNSQQYSNNSNRTVNRESHVTFNDDVMNQMIY